MLQDSSKFDVVKEIILNWSLTIHFVDLEIKNIVESIGIFNIDDSRCGSQTDFE